MLQDEHKAVVDKFVRMQDKARASTAGLAILTALLFVSRMLLDLRDTGFAEANFSGFATGPLFILALVYTVESGCYAINVYNVGVLAQAPLIDMPGAKSEKEWKRTLIQCIDSNNRRIILRQNYLFAANVCMRNAILVVSFIVAWNLIWSFVPNVFLF